MYATVAGLLLCLWIAVLGSYATGQVREPLWLLPALIPLALYALISALQMLASDSVSLAFADYRTSIWYMLSVLLLAVAPWRAEAYRRIALGFTAVALLVGLC